MKIINVDLLDGKPLIPIAVNDDDAARLDNFISDARDYFMKEVDQNETVSGRTHSH